MNQIQRPLVLALLAFLAGLLPSLRFDVPTPLALFLFLLVLGTCTSGWAKRGGVARVDPVRPLLLFVAAGASVGAVAREDVRSDCRRLLLDDQRVEVTGKLAAAFRGHSANAGAPLLTVLDAIVDGIDGCGGEIRARFPATQEPLAIGTHVVLRGRWRPFAPPVSPHRWPRDPRSEGFLLVDTLHVDSAATASPPLPLRLRNAADRRLELLFPRHLPLVEALLLGRREYVDPSVRDRFARAGLSHLLAISGMHVGLLAGSLLLLGSALRLPRRRSVGLTLTLVWIYLLVIGAPASALRAGMMISLALLALLLQRSAAGSAIVATAALLLLAVRPLSILEPGFQLSFAGILAILFLRAPLVALAPEQLLSRGISRTVTDAYAVGVAAFVVTAPIVAHHFGLVAPVSILVGPPAVPLMSLALIGSAAALALPGFLQPVSALLAGGAGIALDLLDRLAGLAAALPYGNGSVAPPPWWSWSVATALGLACARWLAGSGRRLQWIVGVGSGLLVLTVWPLVSEGTPEGVEVHFVDVGQGDAIAIRTPGNRWVLVDAGPASIDYDAGARRVVPFLRANRVRRLEALVLTHPDLDHIGGAGAVLRALPVGHVFEPGLAVGKESYLALLGVVELRGTEWRAARSGRTMVLDGVRFDFLWPDPETVDAAGDANQISAVMRVSYGAFALLLTGDAGTDVEQLLVERHSDALRSQILKLGHHGSTTSTAEEFLDQVQPEIAVVSAGRRNRYGHPAPPVIDRLERRGIPLARTDREGTVSFHVLAGGSEWRRVP